VQNLRLQAEVHSTVVSMRMKDQLSALPNREPPLRSEPWIYEPTLHYLTTVLSSMKYAFEIVLDFPQDLSDIGANLLCGEMLLESVS
jgi:hypothetical protein